ncbi:hypothetical protein HEK616_70750 [Streptomyces nigrescens]|uniref:Uncharacterized protein n=2 Tax=Streptomyces TaxID=1883 RepID=A0ABM8A4T4_STRNI|nr:hypothetical protein [Streptomyces nigrescens]MEE4423747.1 hypothetical protein [Streptomyces sp. DSM 41528]BDM73588.1 hypothetical protein HEK616_70750 [Streptomyces nigrescens]
MRTRTRTRLAAGSVAAAALLTLAGGTVAVADAPAHQTAARPKTDPAPVGGSTDTAARTHDSTGLRDYGRTSERRYRTDWMRESPLRLATCALGTALGSLTNGPDCVGDRMGYRFRDAAQTGRKDVLRARH